MWDLEDGFAAVVLIKKGEGTKKGRMEVERKVSKYDDTKI